MEVTGKIKVINDTLQVSEKFSKRDFVLSTEEMYPQDILFQLKQDKCTLLDMFKVGDKVKVSFNLRGREWTNPKTGEIRYFKTLEAWKIFKEDNNNQNNKAYETVEVEENQEEDDDMPF